MASQSDTARTVIHGLDFGLIEWVVDEQRQRYLRDPGSVEKTWRNLFGGPVAVTSMLRSKAAVSALTDFTEGGFRPVLPDDTVDPGKVARVLLCSGQVFHDLDAHRNATGTAIVRLERLYPFPEEELSAELARFPAMADVRWVQEEPENQVSWSFLPPRRYRTAGRIVDCVSRPEAIAPAVGSGRRHGREQKAVVAAAFQ
ncbi:hypothetical protein ABT090_11595 [Streptomyces asoensis]|uniref:hypothetical protein n=1 Tax=Streptomyces asoensis TaxID=249586 RepID=UPI00332188C6